MNPNWTQDIIDTQVFDINSWFAEIKDKLMDGIQDVCESIVNGITIVIIDGLAIAMFCFGIYYSIKMMCCTKDEKFDEYMTKTMIVMVVYFCSKCAVKLIGLGG